MLCRGVEDSQAIVTRAGQVDGFQQEQVGAIEGDCAEGAVRERGNVVGTVESWEADAAGSIRCGYNGSS